MVLNIIRFIFVVLIGGCTSSENQVIGYLGFAGNEKWAIQFNDCAVVSFEQAQQYIWFDRDLSSINCYTLKDSDTSAIRNRPIRVYSQPNKHSEYKDINKFSQLTVSESGWGTFPSVYERVDSSWFKVVDGWVYLNSADKVLVDFYPGSQSIAKKKEHDAYFFNH